MLRMNALKINQREIDIYATVMKASDLLRYANVDWWEEDNPYGYQRPLIDTRIAKATKYLLYEEGVFPTSILVNIRGNIDFHLVANIEEFGEFGILDVPQRSLPLWIIDGQHRVMAIRVAAKEDPRRFYNYALPVSILNFRSRFDEMRQFFIINSRQKRIRTDLAQRHLHQTISTRGEMEVSRFESKSKMFAAEAVLVVDFLRLHPESPWYGMVKIPSDRRRREGQIVTQTSFASSIGIILKELTKEERDEIREYPKLLGLLLVDYWNALKEIYPEAFANPRNYTIQKTLGCYVFHKIFSYIHGICRRVRRLTKECLKEMLIKMLLGFGKEEGVDALDSKFWDRVKGYPLAKGTGMKMVRELSNHFMRFLDIDVLQQLSETTTHQPLKET